VFLSTGVAFVGVGLDVVAALAERDGGLGHDLRSHVRNCWET